MTPMTMSRLLVETTKKTNRMSPKVIKTVGKRILKVTTGRMSPTAARRSRIRSRQVLTYLMAPFILPRSSNVFTGEQETISLVGFKSAKLDKQM